MTSSETFNGGDEGSKRDRRWEHGKVLNKAQMAEMAKALEQDPSVVADWMERASAIRPRKTAWESGESTEAKSDVRGFEKDVDFALLAAAFPHRKLLESDSGKVALARVIERYLEDHLASLHEQSLPYSGVAKSKFPRELTDAMTMRAIADTLFVQIVGLAAITDAQSLRFFATAATVIRDRLERMARDEADRRAAVRATLPPVGATPPQSNPDEPLSFRLAERYPKRVLAMLGALAGRITTDPACESRRRFYCSLQLFTGRTIHEIAQYHGFVRGSEEFNSLDTDLDRCKERLAVISVE